MRDLRIIELFGGIGSCTQALKRLHVPLEIVDYVEIDKYAVQSYNAINGTNFAPQDITKWDKDLDVDLIMHGSPCQDFSIAGKQAGADEGSGTRSSLMYETLRIVSKLKPKYVIWENVKNVLSKKHIHNFEAYLEKMVSLGYMNYYQVLNAKDYGIPQNRERIFCVSVYNGGVFTLDGYDFEFPRKIELKKRLNDVLECKVDEKYYLDNKQVERILNSTFAQEKGKIQTKYFCDTILARDYKGSKCVQVGQLYGTEREPNPQAGRIYSAEGLSPTMDSCSGGNRMPKVMGQDSIKYKMLENGNIIDDTMGYESEPRIYEETAPTLRSGRSGLKVTEPVTTRGKDVANCIRSTIHKQGSRNLIKNITDGQGYEGVIEPNFRIRKLTPKECWRLMGFSDECFNKAEKVNSNTQLYKQAGNSIVVDVLYHIFLSLFQGVVEVK